MREPLKPIVPAEDHEIVLPCASLMVIMVLLNVEFTWATPDAMFLRSRRRTRPASLAIFLIVLLARPSCQALGLCYAGEPARLEANDFAPDYFFLPAIGLALPLRVRAWVCVRWPRTGS